MQPYFDVDRAQERDSSPVIFGTYVETRTTRTDGVSREAPTSDVAPVSQVAAAAVTQIAAAVATVTPLPLFASAADPVTPRDAAHSARAQREAPQREAPQRDALSSSVQLKLDVVEQSPVAPRSSIAVSEDSAVHGSAVHGSAVHGSAVHGSAVHGSAVHGSAVHGSAVSETDDAETAQRVLHESRMAGAWREWLGALARDPEAALAAAQAYQQLDATGRDEWLAAVDSDLASLGVPAVAVYGPLLAVESDPQRTQRMRQRIARGRSLESPSSVPRRALLGRLPSGVRIGVLVEPLYLQFVQVLACAYVPAQRFDWVRHDPIALDAQAVSAGQVLEGAVLETVPVRLLVDELARTVVSHRRLGGTLPDALCLFANLFGLEHMVGACDELTWR